MDNKLEIIILKHEILELIMDYLVANLNERVNQNHKNKQERGRPSTTHDRKEALEMFSQSSSELWETLDGEKEELAFDCDSK